MKTYERNGEWAGYTIRTAKTGWIVETWSREQGAMSGVRTLLPYSPMFPADMDLGGLWNDCTSNADAIVRVAGDGGGRTLRRGVVVA